MAKITTTGAFSALKKPSYRLVVAASILALGASSGAVVAQAASCSSISECDSKISSLSDSNAKAQNTVGQLQLKAGSYQDAIGQLRQRISSIQGSINTNEAAQTALNAKIAQYQKQIDNERSVLGNDIKSMYVDGSMSNIEMLASSSNLSDYVNKQEYRGVVQDKIQSTLTQIAKLQQQVQAKKTRVDDMLKDLGSQRSQLAAAKAQQDQLLSYNQQQQDSYNSKISNNNSQISNLQHERELQVIANQQLSSGGGIIAGNPNHGNYPANLDNAAEDSLVDPWGMYNRECVSYTAWKVQQTFGYMPNWGGVGNANQWPGDASAYNIPTGSTPRVHSVAIWNVGHFGHSMWVEAVNSDGSIYVSQYNYDYTGHYSEMPISPSMAASLTYIYFK